MKRHGFHLTAYLDVHWNHLSWTVNHSLHRQPHHKYLTHLPACHFNCQSVSPSTQPSLATSVCISTGNLFHLFIFIRHIPASPHPSLHCSTLQGSLQNDRECVEMREVTSSLEWEGCKRKGLCEAQLGVVLEKCYAKTFPRAFYTTKRNKNGCQFETSYFMNSDENGGISSSYIALMKRWDK